MYEIKTEKLDRETEQKLSAGMGGARPVEEAVSVKLLDLPRAARVWPRPHSGIPNQGLQTRDQSQ